MIMTRRFAEPALEHLSGVVLWIQGGGSIGARTSRHGESMESAHDYISEYQKIEFLHTRR